MKNINDKILHAINDAIYWQRGKNTPFYGTIGADVEYVILQKVDGLIWNKVGSDVNFALLVWVAIRSARS